MEMTDLDIHEISLVDKPSHRTPWSIIKKADGSFSFTGYCAIAKTDDEQHEVTGLPYRPLRKDSQNDWATADSIAGGRDTWERRGRPLWFQHKTPLTKSQAIAVDSYILTKNEKVGNEVFDPGSWFLKVKVLDEGLWKAIKERAISGLSIAGRCVAKSVSGAEQVEVDELLELKKIYDDAASALGLELTSEELDSDEREVLEGVRDALTVARQMIEHDMVPAGVELCTVALGLLAEQDLKRGKK